MKKLVIIGKSCSGKTEYAMSLKERGYKIAVACTTRPIRQHEIPDVHYHFTSIPNFELMIANDMLIEYDKFNDWYYGLLKSEWEKADVFILTPKGLKALTKIVGRPMIKIIYMDVAKDIRIARAALRGDNMIEVNRRLKTDDIDFKKFIASKDWDICIDTQIDDQSILNSNLS